MNLNVHPDVMRHCGVALKRFSRNGLHPRERNHLEKGIVDHNEEHKNISN